MNLEIIVLAAGKGTRMRSRLPKVLHKLAGKTMLQHVLDTSAKLAPIQTTIVYGFGGDQVQSSCVGQQLSWVEQVEQNGTGHAVAQALPLLSDNSVSLILYGDVPLITTSTLQGLLDSIDSTEKLAILTCDLVEPSGYGRIVRNEGNEVIGIIEHKDATDKQREIREINTGIMAVSTQLLRTWIPALSNDNTQGEYYLTDIVALAEASDIKIKTHQPEAVCEIEGINSRSQLATLERIHQNNLCEYLMDQGATLLDPSRVDIRGELTVGTDVVIDINVVFEGRVDIAADVSIGPNCVIKDAAIGKGTVINANTVIDGASIGAHCSVGPFGRLRPGTELKDGAKVGNFVEVKKSVIGAGSKVSHLSYIGDAVLGARVNVGAGTITCNYDGKNKFRTVMEDDVFIGSNSSLVAPVVIAKNSTVGAGSTITKDVPTDSLAIARAKQRNVEGWKKP
ncbi:MAG: bifunctional UDP-N-acetylglucosamine diphosphorylase/glucosamine-1-phosphate N-acetyltransferase GlmU [Pseudomonadales bacterium]|nr:bifunctional UDP-N-acetylglucosamine diphosphorylase/glucosamine-1-phosphate N-acetyltransferase GlmU [Pseudomonadales bacterium]